MMGFRETFLTQLVLQLLGGFAVRDTAGTELRIASRKGRALLAFLAARAGETHSRDRLASLLWEEADEELARTSLRQALAAIRKALPVDAHPVLISDPDSLRLDPDLIETDIALLRRSLITGTRAALQEGMAHHRGEFLEGLDARSTSYDEWLNQERQALRRQLADALQKLSALCSAQEDFDGALAASSRLVSLEPLNEAAHRTVMELQARRHAYADALRQYQICRDILRRELDVAPEPATEQLYRDLMRRRRAATTPLAADAVGPLEGESKSAKVMIAAEHERRTELRDAVVLVVRLQGLTELEALLEPEEAHDIGRDFHERVQAIVVQFNGCTDRRVSSGVLVVFGATEVRGNEAEQAVRASLALRQSVTEGRWRLRPGLSLRMGIAQGQLLVGPEIFPLTGRPTHAAYTLAGLAGENGICIAATLRNSLGSLIDAEVLPGTSLPEGEAAWLLQSLQGDGRNNRSPLVGRRPELAMLGAVLDRCRTGKHGRAVVVRGEAGIGKTRVIHAVMAVARENGVAVHASSAFDFGQSPGRRPVTTLALSLLGVSPEAPADERSAAVAKVIQKNQGGIDQLIFLSDLVDAPLNSELAALENAMDTATRQRGRSLALAHLIESAANRSPLLLVIEDVHWTDQDELARFGEIAAVIAHCPALLIMTTRPEGDPIGALWRARARGCPVTTVDLAPLADDEAMVLANHYADLSPEVVAACISRAEGNPLFLDQLFRAAFDGHDCLPGSVRAVILARAERLSGRDRDALQASAVLGQRFSSAALRRLIDDSDFTPQALVETALLREDGDEFEFTHALFRDAIYESTLRSRRRELHRRAANWFSAQDLALRADHLAAAEDPEAAAAYLTAARSEQAASRFERSLMLANKASAAARDPLQLHLTQCLLGELLLTLGRTHDALSAFREAIDFAPDQRRQVDAWIGVASALRVMDRHTEALDALDRAEKSLGECDDIQVQIRISTLRGNLCFPLGRMEDCLREHERAMQLASVAHSPLDLAQAYSGLGDAWYQRGRMRTAGEYFARCLAESRSHNLPGVRMANLPMLALTRLYCGEVACTDQSLEEALDLSRRLSDARSELLTQLVTATAMLIRGRIEISERYAQRTRELAEQVGARRFQAEALSLLAGCHLAQHQRREADVLVHEALQLIRSTSMNYCGPALLGVLARTTTLAEERRQALREGEELLATGCVSHSYFEFYFHAIEVSLRDGLWADAHRYADALSAYTRDEPFTWTELLVRRGHCLAELGKGNLGREVIQELQELRTRCNSLDLRLPVAGIETALGQLANVQA
jgi:DNA-binding SARP family transcriptional activator/tetratricopeptide (TPR) repeat protein